MSNSVRINAIRRSSVLLVVAALVLALPVQINAGGPNVTLVAGGFSEPVYVTHAGDARLFVVEKGGRIRIIGGGTFLDISSRISKQGERGLLALAFHPNYATNRLFYVFYTRASDGDVMISEFKASATDPNVADPDSERVVLTVEHSSATNHNGGSLMFKKKLLYVTLGDGGGSPGTRSQDLSLLVGKILRINPLDPDGPGGASYSIPPKNPYVGRAGRDEIWARGLRNPWRCSFDRKNGKLWCGDVGQGKYEEVNRHRTGKKRNFGWPLLEGYHYYNYLGKTSGALCTAKCRYKPVVEYPHSMPGGNNQAVTGGYVARRKGAALFGRYIFGDYASGRIWAIPAKTKKGSAIPAALYDTDYVISSFGEGADGRLYLVDFTGAVYRLNDT